MVDLLNFESFVTSVTDMDATVNGPISATDRIIDRVKFWVMDRITLWVTDRVKFGCGLKMKF